jgi:hypothetical protein
MGGLLLLEFFDQFVQFLEPRIPDLSVPLEPVMKVAKRPRAKLVESLLGTRLHVDEPGVFQDPQVLGDLRLVELKALTDLVDGAGAGSKELHDAKAVGLGEGSEGLDHPRNIRPNAYARQGMLS